MRRRIGSLILLCAWAPVAAGEIVLLNPWFGPTIQQAIDAAVAGDSLLLCPGVYRGPGRRDIDFRGKAITVRSLMGDPDSCIIDCEGSPASPQRGFLFRSGEGPSSVIEGVTITRGWTSGQGGGVWCEEASPTIIGCILRDNHAEIGGALYCTEWSAPRLIDCILEANDAYHGGAVYSYIWCSLSLARCMLRDNRAIAGGAVYGVFLSPTALDSCTLAENRATQGGACYGVYYSGAICRQCTFYGNGAPSGGSLFCDIMSSPDLENTIIAFGTEGCAILDDGAGALTCCDIYGNAGGDWVGSIAGQLGVNGNISEDPLFCGAIQPQQPYSLSSASPCAPEPNPRCGLIGAWAVGCGAYSAVATGSVWPATCGPMLIAGPNPAPGAVRLLFVVPPDDGPAYTRLTIHDVTGRQVRGVVDRMCSPGHYTAEWDRRDAMGMGVCSGRYFARLAVAGRETVAPLMVVR